MVNCTSAAHTLHCVNSVLLVLLYTVPFIPLFCCHSPVPTITWRKINGNIPKKARLRKSQAVLEIPIIQLEDSGTYECKAENPRGGNSFKGHLQVYSESEHALILIHFNLQPFSYSSKHSGSYKCYLILHSLQWFFWYKLDHKVRVFSNLRLGTSISYNIKPPYVKCVLLRI